MEIDDSIFGKKLNSPFGIDSPLLHGCPFCHPLCLPHLTATTTARYLRPGLLSTANFSACMEAWARWLPQLKKKNKKTKNSSHRPLSDTFPLFSLITKLPSSKQTFKTRGFILSIAPSWMLGGNLKMIYANVISLCVIQHSQLMSELPQPNYKLTRLDITARLMCFSGTCLIARRLRWG